jgi:hypothetical protein
LRGVLGEDVSHGISNILKVPLLQLFDIVEAVVLKHFLWTKVDVAILRVLGDRSDLLVHMLVVQIDSGFAN